MIDFVLLNGFFVILVLVKWSTDFSFLKKKGHPFFIYIRFLPDLNSYVSPYLDWNIQKKRQRCKELLIFQILINILLHKIFNNILMYKILKCLLRVRCL